MRCCLRKRRRTEKPPFVVLPADREDSFGGVFAQGMDKLSKRVLETIRENRLIPAGSSLTAGFSGGADSVCLVATLAELEKLLKFRLKAVHVNHNLRGEEAGRDQEFCRSFCEERGIPYTAVSVDVESLVRKKGLSVEEAARQLRYEALQREAGESGLIAVAHHADDQAETVLFNLCRGTGLKGMRGMEYRRDNIIRPLLDLTRAEILACLQERGLGYVTDSSNASNDYARNRIRNVILPELERINPKAPRHLLEISEKAGEAEFFLEECAEKKAAETAVTEESGHAVRIFRKKLKQEPQILRRYVIINLLGRAGIPLKDWGDVHIGRIDRLLGEARGLHLDLPGGVTAENTDTETVIRKA